MREIATQASHARMRRITTERRHEIAKTAAAARWVGHVAKRPASSRKKGGIKKREKKEGV